ncbi:hypothetical protein JCM3770_003053 [Rhodotorula araucariae]
MDALARELAAVRAKAEDAHALDTAHVDAIIARLELARTHLAARAPPRAAPGRDSLTAAAEGTGAGDQLLPLSSYLKTSSTESQRAHKDWGNALSRLAKSVDKSFGPPPAPLFPPPPAPPPPSSLHPDLLALASSDGPASLEPPASTGEAIPFSTPEAAAALNATIATHLARLGAFDALSTFLAESNTPAPPELNPDLLVQLRALHGILADLRAGSCARALAWVREHPDADPDSELEFTLRKEEYIALVIAAGDEPVGSAPGDAMETDTGAPRRNSYARRTRRRVSPTSLSSQRSAPPPALRTHAALEYGGAHFRALVTPARAGEVCALLAAPLFLPIGRLRSSVYGALFDESARVIRTNAAASAFAAAYLAQLSLPRESPLTVVTDVGGGGALAKIMKVRAVMKEKKTEWSAVGELPVEIPLPLAYRYHSIFACPVSKEQSTLQNPPMLLPCGHVIARESLQRLARGTPTLKCPYCPVVSHTSACVRVYF